MVQMWRSILEPYVEDAEQLKRLSLNVQRICYGFVSQTLLVEPKFGKWQELETDIVNMVNFSYQN